MDMRKKMASLWIGCIADDFTGGSDAASFLRKAGLRTVLLNGIGTCEGLDVIHPEAIVVALKSRSIAAEDAVAQTSEAARWLLEMGARHLYFKYCSTFDSTPAGNIGPVTDALLELTDARYTVLCPSLPVNGRTVRDGILYVDGVPLAESPMRYHPTNPMMKSDLSQLMEEQSRYPCVVLREAQMKDLEEICPVKGRFTIVPPYETDADGQRIAAQFGHLPLLTGGSGLLEHLGRLYKAEKPSGEPGPEEMPGPGETMPRLLLAGSCSAMTQKQVQTYLDLGGTAVRIEPDKLLSGQQTEADLQRAISDAQGDILLYSTTEPKQVKQYQAAGAERVSALLESLMGRLAVYGKEHGFRRIVVAGGETSGAVTQALHAKAYRIGKDAAPGVPEMWPIDQPGLGLVLKSGNFGDESFLLTALTNESPIRGSHGGDTVQNSAG